MTCNLQLCSNSKGLPIKFQGLFVGKSFIETFRLGGKMNEIRKVYHKSNKHKQLNAFLGGVITGIVLMFVLINIFL